MSATMRALLGAACGLAALAGCNSDGSGGNGAVNGSASSNAQQAPTTPPAGAEGLIFAEYDRACANLADVEALKAGATANGWQPYDAEPGSQTARLLAFAETNVRPLLNGAEFNNTAFRKTAGDRQFVLVITDIPAGPAKSTECRVYDFEAEAPPSPETIGAWTSNPPNQRVSEQGLTLYQWTPGFRDGLSQQSVVHMAADSPLREEIPAVGLAVTATLGAASRE